MEGVTFDRSIFVINAKSCSCSGQRRHLIPLPPFQQSSGLLFAQAAPLLEEEWDVGGETLVAEVYDPGRGQGGAF